MADLMSKKKAILKQLTPIGLVPMATATAFLILGSRGSDTCPGHPSLPQFLLLAGTFTIGLSVMVVTSKLITSYGLPFVQREFTREEDNVIWTLLQLRHFLSLCQIVILIVGTLIVAPLASTIHPWDHEHPDAKYYCDYGTVVFSAVFFPVMWLLLLLSLLGYAIIACSIPLKETEFDREGIH